MKDHKRDVCKRRRKTKKKRNGRHMNWGVGKIDVKRWSGLNERARHGEIVNL